MKTPDITGSGGASVAAAAVLTDEAKQAAKAARLRYVTDDKPGIRRERVGEKEFRYIGVDGDEIADEKTLTRIRSLGIPPAWTDVWICPIPHGHLQATGRDAKGRKQYRYHARWREARDETKYDKMVAFGAALPTIREHIARDLSRRRLPREKVLAALVSLLEATRIRIGNEEYAKTNESYGLTTLRGEHVDVAGSAVRFRFRGKSGKDHEIGIRDKKLARIIGQCRDLPGQELFQYLDEEGQPHTIHSEDVNAYIREISGGDFTAKDFRTWGGTLLCALCLLECGPCEKETEAKKNITAAIKQVSEKLGNTPAVCRKCYVHPAVVDSYLENSPIEGLEGSIRENCESEFGLRPEEIAVLNHLIKRIDTAADDPPLKKAA